MRNYKIFALFFISLVLSACSGSAYNLPVVSAEETIQINQAIEEDSKNLKTYKRSDSNYKKRIKRISQRLQKSARPLCEQAGFVQCYFEVTYDNADTVNAYAHEDYKITVFKGFLQYLKNDDEMAALIGHEMGHHLANHNQETLQNAQTGAAVSGLLTAILIGAANANNPNYNAYQQQQNQQTLEDMMKAGFEIGKLSYSKEQEREADLLSAYLLEHAGYNLEKAKGLMYVMAKIPSSDNVPGKAALLKTHPPSSERYVAWEKAIDEIEGNEDKLPYLKTQN